VGQPVASSAETSEIGIKKTIEARSRKKIEERPYSAARGQFFTVPIAATLIIARVKIPMILLLLAMKALPLFWCG
jgi:hypothetical protein